MWGRTWVESELDLLRECKCSKGSKKIDTQHGNGGRPEPDVVGVSFTDVREWAIGDSRVDSSTAIIIGDVADDKLNKLNDEHGGIHERKL